MTMADVVEIDAATGEVTERDFTPEELEQRDADVVAQVAADLAAQAAADEKAAVRASALAKLAQLGLTEAEAMEIVGS